jgi:hypothetical protein
MAGYKMAGYTVNAAHSLDLPHLAWIGFINIGKRSRPLRYEDFAMEDFPSRLWLYG